MVDRIILKDRGTITLPAKLRKKLRLQAGDVLEVEEKEGAIVLTVMMVLPKTPGSQSN